MRKSCLLILFIVILANPTVAAIEVALQGAEPVVIDEIYHRDGLVYIPIDDLLLATGLKGEWDAVEHVYRIKSTRGVAIISPGSSFLRIDDRFVPLQDRPRFIDNRLRVTEGFVLKQLTSLTTERLLYRNLDPVNPGATTDDSALDRLFSFMLKKKKSTDAAVLRAVAIDPGHGGHDPGSIGLNGLKEKDVTLAVAQSLQKIVKMNLGIPVYLSRDADYALSLEEHLKPATEPDVDALLLIHAQVAVNSTASGIYLYIRNDEESQGDGESLRLANSLSQALKNEGLTVQAILEAPLLPLGRGDLPTVLIEMGFLSHPEENLLLGDEEGQVRMASGLFNGLESFMKNGKGTMQ